MLRYSIEVVTDIIPGKYACKLRQPAPAAPSECLLSSGGCRVAEALQRVPRDLLSFELPDHSGRRSAYVSRSRVMNTNDLPVLAFSKARSVVPPSPTLHQLCNALINLPSTWPVTGKP